MVMATWRSGGVAAVELAVPRAKHTVPTIRRNVSGFLNADPPARESADPMKQVLEHGKRSHPTCFGETVVSFYEKVIKVKADVAALL
jgi:hypothetical protein